MVAFVLASAIAMMGPQAGQQPAQPPSSTPAPAAQDAPAGPANAEDLPVSIERIQRALAAPKPIELKEQRPVFRLEVLGKKPTIEEILGEKFWVGPVPYGGMTHQDFMNMATPKELQPYGGFSGGYLVSEIGLTLAEQWVLKQASRKFHDAKHGPEREA